MKKLMIAVTAVACAFAATARGESDGGRDDSRLWLPIGLSILTPPVQLPSPSHTVYGAMLNLGYGQLRNLVFAEVGVVNNVTDTVTGAQVGAVNIAGTCFGAQVGALNIASKTVGVQVGALNFTGDLHGLQLGVLNFSGDGGAIVFPILNFGF